MEWTLGAAGTLRPQALPPWSSTFTEGLEASEYRVSLGWNGQGGSWGRVGWGTGGNGCVNALT